MEWMRNSGAAMGQETKLIGKRHYPLGMFA